jgi:uncharacterized membrane protein
MTERTFERVVAGVLVAGVSISATLIVVGMVAALIVGWGGGTELVDPTDFGDLLSRLREGEPLAITQLGLIVLILTPVVRVACSVVGFALEHDRLYVAITLAVLAVLLGSLVLFR